MGALLAGRGLNRLPARAAWRAALAASLILLLFSGSARETAFQRARGRPADRLLALLELEDPLETRLYAGFLARPLRERAPTLEVRPARDLAHVAALLAADPTPPRVVWVAQDVRGAERLEPVVEDGELRVYRWDRGRAGL
ncbi:MAG: hypothetical protein R3F62_19385 [Planctomycetota bacterium]